MDGAEERISISTRSSVACEGLEITHAPDGCVVYDAAAEKVHYLNPTAGVVYELCDGVNIAARDQRFPRPAYGLDQEPIEATRDCLKTLIEQGLVRPCAKSSAEP